MPTMETKNPSKILVVDDDPRLRDLLRRYLGEQGFNVYVAENAPSETTEVFEFGEFALNLATRTLTKAGQEIPLTTGEFSVLKVFARHPLQPLSREKLMELARGREYEVFDRSLDVQISRLRKLIEPDPGSPRFIQTVWGLGYVFIPDGAA
jgi:two-component system phosphate regulon response regulator OmpR